MINSMTGYGRAEMQAEGIVYSVEIKTVNNKHFKLHMKNSELISFLADDIEKLLRQNICRGTVIFSLRSYSVGNQMLYELEETVLQSYYQKLKNVAQQCDPDQQIRITDLLTLPGVVEPKMPDDDLAEKIKGTVFDVISQALEKLKQMRREEGKLLEQDMLKNLQVIQQRQLQISDRVDDVLQSYHERLSRRVNELLSKVSLEIDQETLARELAVYAERSDIAEELTRIDSHIKQFKNSCSIADYVGRRLDFLSQELLREANTIGSKAADSQIVQWVVDIKCAIDRIKEQVQNVE